jgi:hydrogen peroxide-dependent heme synthase
MTEHSPLPSTAPETLEGWYALHQIFTIDRTRADLKFPAGVLPRHTTSGIESTQFGPNASGAGWSVAVALIGSSADLMVIHFRPTLDEIGQVQRAFARDPAAAMLDLRYSFLSVTEAGLYHLSADLARLAIDRGGAVGDEAYRADVSSRGEEERRNPHVKRRLEPTLPDAMPYVSFYPMSKRRAVGQNWYGLPLDERSRLMHTHGMTGRRYAGRVLQIITGAIGLDAWEWGVTLFAKDPLDFKKLVTEMRFDEVSAQYAEFGDFYVGRRIETGGLAEAIETIV